MPAPAPPPRSGAAGRFGSLAKRSGRRRNPTHSSQSPAIAGERQLSERPCVREVSFCQTTGIQTKPGTAGGSSPAVPQSAVPTTGWSRNPKAQWKGKASQKALVNLAKLCLSQFTNNWHPTQKNLQQSKGQRCRTGKGQARSPLESQPNVILKSGV